MQQSKGEGGPKTHFHIIHQLSYINLFQIVRGDGYHATQVDEMTLGTLALDQTWSSKCLGPTGSTINNKINSNINTNNIKKKKRIASIRRTIKSKKRK